MRLRTNQPGGPSPKEGDTVLPKPRNLGHSTETAAAPNIPTEQSGLLVTLTKPVPKAGRGRAGTWRRKRRTRSRTPVMSHLGAASRMDTDLVPQAGAEQLFSKLDGIWIPTSSVFSE